MKQKRKVFYIKENVDIPVQMDTSKETHVAPKSVNTQCGRFSGQRRNLEQPPFQELANLLVTLFEQARGCSAVISDTLLGEMALHIATGHVRYFKTLKLLMFGLMVSSSDSVVWCCVNCTGRVQKCTLQQCWNEERAVSKYR
jgi:hypothetical protein